MNRLLDANSNVITIIVSSAYFVVGVLASYFFLKLTKPGRNKKAYKLLKGFKSFLGEPLGEYYFANSKDDNKKVAEYIYRNADEEIIATSFNEDPSIYGENDLARAIKNKTRFTRLTSGEVCDARSEKKVEKNILRYLNGSSFIILPTGASYTRIDGIFCKFSDDSYLTFFAFRNPLDMQQNKGVVFRNGIAKSFFEYYEALKHLYR